MKGNYALCAGLLILRLNRMIGGWANYHRHITSKVTFNHVDHAIYQTVRQWMKRRHPRKSDSWIAKKYFTSLGTTHRVFYGQVHGQSCYLTKASHVPIKRHVKIPSQANPYDPSWEVS